MKLTAIICAIVLIVAAIWTWVYANCGGAHNLIC